jgi:hypothetical protein
MSALLLEGRCSERPVSEMAKPILKGDVGSIPASSQLQ